MLRTILALLLVTLAAPTVARADARAEARAHVERATALHAEGELADALTELTIAYSLDPQPALLYAIAQIHVQLGQCPQAITFYQRFLSTRPERPAAAAAREAIDVCEHAPPPAPPPPEPEPPPVDVAPRPPPAPPPPIVRAPAPAAWYRDAPGWALVGGGVALAVGGGVTYGLARTDLDDAESAPTYADYARAVDRAHSKRLVASLVAGASVALTGLGAYRLWRHPGETVRVALAPTAGGGVLSWAGQF